MPLEPGAKIGPYQIIAPVAAGNSGETYKASDTRANRTVSIRLLPREFSENRELKERFERETKTIAALNHPHISTPVDVGRQDGADYVVMEYLEGETLAERLKRGALGLEEALKIAIAIADALDKAHRQGVTHRGLNPSSVALTRDGAMLRDFGIAGLKQPPNGRVSTSMLSTRTAVPPQAAPPSEAAPYTAPEQFEGAEPDARTDIFALGAMLYEMITGKPPFEGKTQAVLISAIMTVDPDPVSKAQPLAPPALVYVVQRCLAKDSRERVQTAWDLMGQLQWIAENASQTGVPAPIAAKQKKKDRLVWTAVAAGALLAIILAWPALLYVQGSAEPEEARYLLNLGGGQISPTISPNGRWIAAARGTPGLDVLSADSVTPQTLVPENLVYNTFWSPDSHSFAFFDAGNLKKADVSGGPPQNICTAANPTGGGTWSQNGIILFASAGKIYRVLAAGGQPTAVAELDASQQEIEQTAPFFLPDGRHYLYLSVSAQPSKSAIYVGLLDSKEKTRLLTSESRAVYSAPGYLLFNRERTLFAQPFDADKLILSGEPTSIADGLPFNISARAGFLSPGLSRSVAFGLSQTGVLAYRTGGSNPAQQSNNGDQTLVWIDRSGRRTGQVGVAGTYPGIDLSPDGKQIAVHRHEGTGGDAWILDSAPGRTARLTFNAAQENSQPIWSPDGMQIAFGSQRNGKWGIYLKHADGTGNEELLLESEFTKLPMSWSPDGKLVVYWMTDPKTRGDIWAIPVAGERKAIPILQTQYDERTPQVSPDGKWLAYSSDLTGTNEIYIKPFPDGPGTWQVSMNGGVFPRWRRDGKELFFYFNNTINAADIQVTGSSVQPGVPKTLFGIGAPGTAHSTDYHRFAVSADGQRFLMAQSAVGANLTGGLADQIASVTDGGSSNIAINNALNSTPIVVILNWPKAVKRK